MGKSASINSWSAPSHYLNQFWNIVNSNIRNKLHLNLKRNSYIFIQENVFENVVCEIAAILSRLQYVKPQQNMTTYEPCAYSWDAVWFKSGHGWWSDPRDKNIGHNVYWIDFSGRGLYYVNPLRADILFKKHKYTFPSYIIPPEPILTCCQLNVGETWTKYFLLKKWILRCLQDNRLCVCMV